MSENTKFRYALLRQSIIQNGIETVSGYVRLVSENNESLYCHATDRDELRGRSLFAGEGGRDDVIFGLNRRFFGTSLLLRNRDGDVLLQVKHRNFTFIGFGNAARSSILDANGEVLLNLAPSAYFENNLSDFFLARAANDLVLKRGDIVLGYTGETPGRGKQRKRAGEGIDDVLKNVVHGAVRLRARLAGNHAAKRPLMEDGVSPGRLIEKLTLVGEGITLDPKLVLFILLFQEQLRLREQVSG